MCSPAVGRALTRQAPGSICARRTAMIPPCVTCGSAASIERRSSPSGTKQPVRCCWCTAGCCAFSATVTRRCAGAPIVSRVRSIATFRPSGARVAPMLAAVAAIGPPRALGRSPALLDGAGAGHRFDAAHGWHAASGQQFFPKVALQPYAQCLAAIDVRPVDRDLPQRKYACPFCGGPPQLSVLQSAGDADGGGRQLLCATCFTDVAVPPRPVRALRRRRRTPSRLFPWAAVRSSSRRCL